MATALPSQAEALLAKETGFVLASVVKAGHPLNLRMLSGPTEGTYEIPAIAVRMLMRILEEMASGNGVALTPVHAELTTQQAADMLKISRPSLIRLLDGCKMEFRRVGKHRRVRLAALLAYKSRVDAEQDALVATLNATTLNFEQSPAK